MSPHVGMAVLSSPIPLLQRVCQRCLLILACMCGREFEVAFFFNLFIVSACSWHEWQCFGRGRDRGLVLCISLFRRVLGWWVDMCMYTHKTTWVLDVSPGVGRTPGEQQDTWHILGPAPIIRNAALCTQASLTVNCPGRRRDYPEAKVDSKAGECDGSPQWIVNMWTMMWRSKWPTPGEFKQCTPRGTAQNI